MKEKKTKKQLKKGANNPEESKKQVQKTQKVTINYFSRGEFREKRMNMMDIYAMIRDNRKIDLRNWSNSVFLGNYLRREQFDRGKGRKRRKHLVYRMLQKQPLTIDAIKV